MKIVYKSLIILIMIVSAYALNAQDLIVTTHQDSIHCKITKQDKQYIYFTHYFDGDIISALIEKKEVKKETKDFYSFPTVPIDYIVDYRNYDVFSIGVNIGFSKRTAMLSDSIPNDFKEHFQNLMSGFNLGIDINYFYSENFGFGFKINRYNAYSITHNIYVEKIPGLVYNGDFIDILSISYLAPCYHLRYVDKNNKYTFGLGISMGYLEYNLDRTLVKYNETFNGSTLGTSWDLNFDIRVIKGLKLGGQVSLISGWIDQFTYSDGEYTEEIELESGSYENINRIDLSVGLSYAF